MTDDNERAREQAKSQLESIIEMVAALNCDYDRLEELKEEKSDLEDEVKDATEDLRMSKRNLERFNEASQARMDELRRQEELGEDVEIELDKLEETQDAYREALDDAGVALADAENALSDWRLEYATELEELIQAAGDCKDNDAARERIMEDPLSVEVRSDWSAPGGPYEACEFKILLCTGGPAVQIVGELDQYHQPSRARLMYQDWVTPWEEVIMDSDEYEAVLEYCRQFYFGD
jgi:hypothetical protein